MLYHLLKLFQTCMNFYLLMNTKEDILKNVCNQKGDGLPFFPHTIDFHFFPILLTSIFSHTIDFHFFSPNYWLPFFPHTIDFHFFPILLTSIFSPILLTSIFPHTIDFHFSPYYWLPFFLILWQSMGTNNCLVYTHFSNTFFCETHTGLELWVMITEHSLLGELSL